MVKCAAKISTNMQRKRVSLQIFLCLRLLPQLAKCDEHVSEYLNPLPTPKSCPFTIVGGGWAGIYAGWRLVVDEKRFNGSDVCIFEGSQRFGGRTYTIFGNEMPNLQGLILDIGAYRFALPQHLPADLLLGPLNLSSGCYIPSCKPEPLDDNLVLHKLVDPTTGDSAGYGLGLLKMMTQMSSMGVRMLLHHKLEAIKAIGPHDVRMLWTAEDKIQRDETHAKHVFLNLPRHAVQALRSDSVIFEEASAQTQQLLRCSPELYGNESREASVKVYLVYHDAWWLTKLGLHEGEVNSLETDPPVYIRYHDGPTHCNQSGCRGALLVQYAHTLETGAAWYMQFQRNWNQTLGVFGEGPLLNEVHQKLIAMHSDKLRSAGVDPNQVQKPVAAVIGFWTHFKQVVFAPAPDPLSFSTGRALPPCLHGIAPLAYWQRVRKPVEDRQIFLANNDWWLEEPSVDLMPPYWAEVSLRTAERVLHDHMGLKRPTWLNKTYFQKSILGEGLPHAVIV